MPPHSTDDAALIVAAQAGDRRALDVLIEAYLPFVYTIVRRAVDADADVDDVVQETMVRVIRDLPDLRDPATFRAWVGTITVRQISNHLQRLRSSEPRAGDLAGLSEFPDADGSFEGLTLLRLGIAAQRRQAAQAARWLDDEDRVLLSLWWLELAGRLTRTELAAAAGVSVAHAGVRVQRMRQQLEQCRALLAALDTRPRCGELDLLVADWDGVPSSVLRKRLARHVRGCAICDPAAAQLMAADKLLMGLALLPVPVALTAAVLGKAGTATVASSVALAGAAKAGVLGHLAKALAVPKVAAAVVTGTVVVGATVAVITWPATTPPPLPAVLSPPAAVATPARSPAVRPPSPSRTPGPRRPTPSRSPAGLLAIGLTSLEAANDAGLFVTTAADLAVFSPVTATAGTPARRQATFTVVAGLADVKCVSLRASDGRYLRHLSWRLLLSPADDTDLFRGDATFCVRPADLDGAILLESRNYPGWFVHRRGTELWVDLAADGTADFDTECSFRARPPLAP
ncbi:sigma-70 family RNA polymerase sigma factor [Catellatospora sichuanensis]|uniref:sigma-70 family RNA polymerase sigma factor n=1 Tax=Catellatospora sichuanensis TaxID=1969805 RepID=UPI0011824612|nr:sigma-70 family RNA polymerase sigma factor [Catellatospora sichuanensis]